MSLAILSGCLAVLFAGLGQSAAPKSEGYLAEPPSPYGRGVLVLHPWWGLNADVKALCDRLAKAGYVAYAPDLFDGKVVATPAEAEALVKAYNPKEKELKAEILQAAKVLEARTGTKQIAVLGLSFGAYYALEFSNEQPERAHAVVLFYGTGSDDFGKSKAAFLGHFAEKDEFEPKEAVDGLVKALKDAGRPAEIHTYPGTGHWFFEPSVEGHYDKAASDLAWERTLRFLRERLPAEAQALPSCNTLPYAEGV